MGRCHQCARWMRSNPDDDTAPEGECTAERNYGHWPSGYWPYTLASDSCPGFVEITEITEEEGK